MFPTKMNKSKLIGASIVYYPNFWSDSECDYYFVFTLFF